MAKGSILCLLAAGNFLYACGNQQGAESDADDTESTLSPTGSPADTMNTGLNGRESGSDTISVTGTATPPANGDTISIGTGSTGGSGGTTGGGSGTPHDKTNPHIPDNKQ